MILRATARTAGRNAARQPALPPRNGLVRRFSRSGFSLDASQPATSTSTSTNPHAARVAAASGSNNASGGDTRSRLAKLQAQRLEELNRGRSGGGAGGARPNKPEQKWSNRTLIALATSVGACTYLMGTYHGYNAGKQHALEASTSPLDAVDVAPASVSPSNNGASRTGTLQASSLSQSLLSLLPLSNLSNSIHCEPASQPSSSSCRLAEFTQYHCDLHTNRVVCQPIDRIFRICKGRPAVEVSHIVEFDDQGRPYLPAHLSEAMPPSSHWHELRSPDL